MRALDSRVTEVIIYGRAACPTVRTIESTTIDGDLIHIVLGGIFGCETSSEPETSFARAVDIGFLEAGTYDLRVDIVELGGGEDESLLEVIDRSFTVFPSPAALQPLNAPAVESKPLRFRLAGLAPPCPTLAAAPQIENDRVTLRFGQDSGCSSGPQEPYVLDLPPIGPLDAGTYTFEVREDNEQQRLLQSREITVLPDPVALLDRRYAVQVDWLDFQGTPGTGKAAIAPSADSSVFYFFEGDNWELMVKVVDGCAINGHRWVFGAASTTVQYSITIVDLEQSGVSWTFTNPLGEPSPAFADTEAFVCD